MQKNNKNNNTNIRILSFTEEGERLAEKLREGLGKNDGSGSAEEEVKVSASEIHCDRCFDRSNKEPGVKLSDWVREGFAEASALVFIGAAGIAVRSIAPFLRDKTSDPAVVVLDEKGRNVISLLSGHLGGANALTKRIAGITGGNPVITTATDINHRFAVDLWAREQALTIIDPKGIKIISSAVLQGKSLCFRSIYPIRTGEGTFSSFLWNTEDGSVRELPAGDPAGDIPVIRIDYRKPSVAERTGISDNYAIHSSLLLCPKTLYLGIGCRKGISQEKLEEVFEEFLKQRGILREGIAGAASIVLKKEEEGLAGFCKKNGFSAEFFSPAELLQLSGEYSYSEFVKETTGVDCVSERSAVLSCIRAMRKRSGEGKPEQEPFPEADPWGKPLPEKEPDPWGKPLPGKEAFLTDSDLIIEKKFAGEGVTFALASYPVCLHLPDKRIQR